MSAATSASVIGRPANPAGPVVPGLGVQEAGAELLYYLTGARHTVGPGEINCGTPTVGKSALVNSEAAWGTFCHPGTVRSTSREQGE